MKNNFTIVYDSKKEYHEVGYHATFAMNKDSILKEGFKKSTNDDDWLGEGVYFWTNEDNADWWKKNSSIMKKCILICDLKCPAGKYLDLDSESGLKEFIHYLDQYSKDMKKTKGKKPNFSNIKQCRKYYCDIYCSHKDIWILSRTFAHDISKYGFIIETKKRKQICVRESECISVLSIKE